MSISLYMTTPVDIIHDLQMFINQWAKEKENFDIVISHLNKKYNITPYSLDDEYNYGFILDGVTYGWDYNTEELYIDGDDSTPALTSGPAFEYARQYDKALTTAYNNVEREMTYRGWVYDRDEYCHNLFKDGWVTDLSYWSGGCDFDDAVGEIYHDEEI